MNLEEFSVKVRKLMIDYDINRFQLAKKLGWSYNAVCAWVHGDRMPTVDALIGMAKIFRVSIDWLLGVNYGKG